MILRVIVVEDEEQVRKEIVLTTPWEKFSLEVIGEADNGIDGEKLINKLKPDIVVTDIRMPGIDGITMLERTNPRAAIILTGFSEFEYARKAIKLGVSDFIVKPVDDEEFYCSLENISQKLIRTSEKDKLLINNMYKGITASKFKEFIGSPVRDKKELYVSSAISFIHEHYFEDMALGEAAFYVGINESYLSRLFREKTDYSFMEYVKGYRIKKALELLKKGNPRINKVARETGFRDMSYFSSVFRKYVGVSPSQYVAEQESIE